MSFAWIDRDGRAHQLETVNPIVTEVNQIRREVDALLPLLTSGDRPSRDTARRAIAPLQCRLAVLSRDIERWNAQVHANNLSLSRDYIDKIAALPAALRRISIVVALHDEHDQLFARTAGDLPTREAALAGSVTAAQRAALNASDERVPLQADATRAEAHAALQLRPQFARACADTAGWFAWTDRHGHAHRLVDPLPIEREVVTLAADLMKLGESIRKPGIAPDQLHKALAEVAVGLDRLATLKGDLDRFQGEEDARDFAACQQFAADWRSKRSSS